MNAEKFQFSHRKHTQTYSEIGDKISILMTNNKIKKCFSFPCNDTLRKEHASIGNLRGLFERGM
jgi:hypothetical protein